MLAYFKRLNEVFGWRFLIYLFFSNMILKGILYYLSYPIMLPLFKDILNIPADDTQIYIITTMIPWTIKPLFGLLSDIIEVRGTHKALWLYCGILIGCFGSGLIFLAYENLSVIGITMCFLCIQFEISLIDLMSESTYSAILRDNPSSGSDIVTLTQIYQTLGALAASGFIGVLADDFLYYVVFIIQCILAISPLVPTFLGWLPERTSGTEYELKPLLESKGKKQCLRIVSSSEYIYKMTIVIIVITLGAPIIGIIINTRETLNAKLAGFFISLVLLSIILFLTYITFVEPDKPNIIFRIALYQSVSYISRPSLSSALSYFYTATEDCLFDGPHFTFKYYLTYIGIASSLAYLVGSLLYQIFMSKLKYRVVLIITTCLSCVGSLTDLFIISRLNVRIGISDNVAFVLGGGILQPILKTFEYSISSILIAKVVRKGMEGSMVALMSGIVNFVWMISEIFGAIIYQSAGITTLPPCDFSLLWILIIVCNVASPLIFNIPAAFLIPNVSQTVTFD